MALQHGSRIGPYEVIGALGAGGMGEVYRARDSRLNRDVAVKLLPEAFAADADRVARFLREAKVLASLNHPNIAAIFGFEETTAGRAHLGALVMELVEGPTLADRIAGQPLPEDDVRAIGRQIAAALEAAHEQGVIHRDLKPANVKIRPDGTVKVLDFGLAKMVEPAATSGELLNSPTITSPAMTERGIILGTAAYMAPEQARGKFVDKRADIWAFGAVLFEMLTGRRAFEGEDFSDTLANVLKQDPSYDAVPRVWRPLLRRCLAKDPKKRLRDIGDAAMELESIADPGPEASSSETSWRRRLRVWQLVAVTGVVIGLVGAAAAWRRMGSDSAPLSPAVSATFDIPLPAGTGLSTLGQPLSISPDGQRLAFITEEKGARQLQLRDLGTIDVKPFPGVTTGSVIFSPNGESVLLISLAGDITRMPLDGRSVEAVCAGNNTGFAWVDDGTIVFTRGGLFRSRVGRCDAERLTTPDASGTISHRWPEPIRGTDTILYTALDASLNNATIVALDSATRAEHIVTEGMSARLAAPGWLLFARRRPDTGVGQLFAAAFDERTATLTGAPSLIVDGVGLEPSGVSHFSVSTTGTLAYTASVPPVIRVISPAGEVRSAFPVGQQADMIAVSPDGRRAILTHESRLEVIDLERGIADRIPGEPGQYRFPTWLPDGRRVSFRYQALGQKTYQVVILDLARGTREVMMTVASDLVAGGISSWSADGLTAYGNHIATPGNHDLFRVSLGGPRSPEPVSGATPAFEGNARLSPDGKLLAYIGYFQSQADVFVQPTEGGERVKVTTGGALDPVWGPRGLELFYRSGGRIFSVPMSMKGNAVSAGPPRLVMERPFYSGIWVYGVMPDGRIVTLERSAPITSIRIVTNWPRLLPPDAAPRRP